VFQFDNFWKGFGRLGLLSHYKETIKGFDFLSVNHLQVRAMSLEYRFKNTKESCETHQSIHVDCGFNNSDDVRKEVYVAEFVWPSEAKSYSCSSFSRSKRIGKNKPILLSVFLNVIAYLMNYLKTETSSCLMPYYRLRSWSGVHIASGIIIVPMQLMIAMFSVDRYNRPIMKDYWLCMRCKITRHLSLFRPLIWTRSVRPLLISNLLIYSLINPTLKKWYPTPALSFQKSSSYLKNQIGGQLSRRHPAASLPLSRLWKNLCQVVQNVKVLFQLEQAKGAKGKKCYYWWVKTEEFQWQDSS